MDQHKLKFIELQAAVILKFKRETMQMMQCVYCPGKYGLLYHNFCDNVLFRPCVTHREFVVSW
jgi:hypothetical protein